MKICRIRLSKILKFGLLLTIFTSFLLIYVAWPKYREETKWSNRELHPRFKSSNKSQTSCSSKAGCDLPAWINKANRLQKVRGQAIFGRLPSPSADDAQVSQSAPESVIVIQVHNRPKEFRIQLEALRKVAHIDRALLVFSHDYYSEELNELINNINFTRTLQIFYPFSIQLFPNEYPGKSPQDCPQPQTTELFSTCINKDWADLAGNYREANIVQVKLHWLWKANFVFNHLAAVKNFSKHILFLEEDHYVVEDILHVLHLVEDEYVDILDHKTMIAMGDHKVLHDQSFANNVFRKAWQHNLGMGISRENWHVLMSCINVFCNTDDYNWDWSLRFVSWKCLEDKLGVLAMQDFSRVYHLGICEGLHHHSGTSQNCSVETLVTDIMETMSSHDIAAKLFPTQLALIDGEVHSPRRIGPNGGWSDKRDQALCKAIAKSNVVEFLSTWASTNFLKMLQSQYS